MCVLVFAFLFFVPMHWQYNTVPRQIVTPYKPSEDIEQTPLLLPATPTSPDSLQTASGYFPNSGAMSLAAMGQEQGATGSPGVDMFGSTFNFNHSHTSVFTSSNPFAHGQDVQIPMVENSGGGFTNANMDENEYAKVSGCPFVSTACRFDFNIFTMGSSATDDNSLQFPVA